VAEHWQTHLAAAVPGTATVEPLRENKLSCAARVRALDDALAAINGPVILVAHSAGVMTVAHWARQHRRAIHGALLATPADLETPLPEGYPTLDQLSANGWLPVPREPLPFPALVAASRNDPLARFVRVAAMAQDWHARCVDLGEVGHLNPASGYGAWPMAQDLIEELF